MNDRWLRWRDLGLGMALCLGAAAPAAAQGIGSIFSLSAGPSQYHLSGTGTTYVVAVRFERRLGPYMILEPGFAFLSYKPDVGGRTNYLFPEMSVQGQGYLGPLRPYLGGGMGFANITNGPNFNKLTLHATAGVRVRLQGVWGLRFEFRERSVDPWNGRTSDFTVGISRQAAMGF